MELILRIKSNAATLLCKSLLTENLTGLYTKFDKNGEVSDNLTRNKNVVLLEVSDSKDVIIAAYGIDQVQRWSIKTNTPTSLARKLVQHFGLLCEAGMHEQLFS